MPETPVPDSPNALPLKRRGTYQDAIDYLFERIDYERSAGGNVDHRFRLERTVELFEKLALGDYLHRPTPIAASNGPKVPVVHIAGTKGKGSTATMVSAILTAAGYRVGLYTSPHLTDLEERFRIDGEPCRRESLVELVEIIAPIVDRFDASPHTVSFFELTTAMAVLYFDRNDCDVVVLEVGLGGRLDSTNVCASTVAAITSIGLDHQRALGDTISEIAAEKAGIIKAPVPVVSGVTLPAAANEIRTATRRAGGELLEKGDAFDICDIREVAGGSEFVYCTSSPKLLAADSAERLPLFLPLIGVHQVDNAAVAISIVRRLAESLPVTDSQIADGLRQVRCSGRLERFQLNDSAGDSVNDPQTIQIILDTAHNHDSIIALCNAMQQRTIGLGRPADSDASAPLPRQRNSGGEGGGTGQLRRPIVVVFATSRDKDVTSMATELAKMADQIICTRFTTNPRFVDVDQLSDAFAADIQLLRQSDPHVALAEAIELASPSGTVVICGSFFLAGQLRPDILAMCGEKSVAVAEALNASDVIPDRQDQTTDRASSTTAGLPESHMEAP